MDIPAPKYPGPSSKRMGRNRIRLDKDTLEDLYLKKHMTGEEIANLCGVTRQGVYKAMRRLGIDMSQAERFITTCDHCEGSYDITRGRYNAQAGHYCSQACYTAHKQAILPARRYNRQAKKIARAVMEKHLGRKLVGNELVHHIDGDELNNSLDNLMLFINSSEHMRFHHQMRIATLKHD